MSLILEDASLNAPYEGLYLEEVHEKFGKELMKSSEFPSMEVYNDDNSVIWCEVFSNRRLWVLFSNVGVLFASVQTKLFSKLLFTIPPLGAKRPKISHPHRFPAKRGGGGEIRVALARPINKE